ncbi:MAG: hypothetical protein KDB23_27030, partial [Planctomycetales bacterium]|nr:hypothetical protein [Planctomycetales bacterium]
AYRFQMSLGDMRGIASKSPAINRRPTVSNRHAMNDTRRYTPTNEQTTQQRSNTSIATGTPNKFKVIVSHANTTNSM